MPVLLLCVFILLPFSAGSQETQGTGRLYRQAEYLFRNNQQQEAVEIWKRILEQSPSHFNTHLALARYYTTRNPAAAQKHLESARTIRPGSDRVHFLLGRQLERQKKWLEAAEAYRQAIRLNARYYAANKRLRDILRKLRSEQSVVERAAEQFLANPNLGALTLFGRLVMRENQPRQALLEFESLLEKVPQLPEVYLWIARAHRSLGQPGEEIAAYRIYLGRNQSAQGVWLVLLERMVETGDLIRAEEPVKILDGRFTGKNLSKRESARFFYLKSGLAIARGNPSVAGSYLLESGQWGFDRGIIEKAYQQNVKLYPEDSELWIKYGHWLVLSKRVDKAPVAFLQAAKLNPAPPVHKETIDALARLVQDHPRLMIANISLGELYLLAGEEKKAIPLLRKIPPGDELDRKASLLLGVVHTRRKEAQESLDAFTRYVFSFPDRAGMNYARGRVFMELGDKKAAAAVWEKDIPNLMAYPDALIYLAAQSEKDGKKDQERQIREMLRSRMPDNLGNRQRLGSLYQEAGELDRALAEWEVVANQKKGDFDLLVMIGKVYLGKGETDHGVDTLLKASQVRELDRDTNLLLGKNLLARKEYLKALSIYSRLFQSEPTHPDLTIALPELVLNTPAPPAMRLTAARIAEKQNQSDLAVDILEDLIRDYPENHEGRFMLAGLFMVKDEPAEVERIILSAPGGKGLSTMERLQLLASAQERLGKQEAFLETLGKMVALQPENREHTRRYGLMLAAMKRPDDAVPHLERALKVNSGDREVLKVLLEARMSQGDNLKALPLMEQMLKLEPDNREIRVLAIRLLTKNRKWPQLIVHLEKWVKDNPSDFISRHNLITAYLQEFDPEGARPHYRILQKQNPAMAERLARYFEKPKK